MRTRRPVPALLAVVSLVASGLLMLSLSSPAAADDPTHASSFDDKGDYGVLVKSRKNRFVDILSGTTTGSTQPSVVSGYFAMKMLVRKTPQTGRFRQNFAWGIKTNKAVHLFSYSTYGKRKGFQSEILKDGKLEPITYTCPGFSVLVKEGYAQANISKLCLRGDHISQVGFYSWQTGEFRPKHPRRANDWAQDVLIDSVSLDFAGGAD